MAEYFYTSLKTVMYTGLEWCRFFVQLFSSSSLSGKGRCFDNIFIERLWRSLKYEKIYINELDTPRDVRIAVKEYFNFYNYKRPHQSLNYKVPADIFFEN